MRIRVKLVGALVSVSLVAGAGGCIPDDQRTDTLDPERAQQRREALPPDGRVQLDSGNAAYSEGSYEVALGHYRRATDVMPDNAASWFGIAMAATALGDSLVADSAMTRAREIVPGASLIHPNGRDGADR
jgi:tetratricopeptide (TPR) repeat protein